MRIEFIRGTAHFYPGLAAADTEMVGIQYAGTLPAGSLVKLSNEHTDFRWANSVEARELLPVKHFSWD